ncbi:bifunctional diguanylate cyclase/phosphodiesterase [Hyphomicrobium sp. 99]|uniref:putative bifunctional diguanylate cyclase/phosphodiesterase n=1 Tax=Hyphomicrobium sp. 99 TaxID=1163419 RepID=UPI0006973C46|nr:EAL domain-containing protein [Hyphomicrobium sp. 99]
MDAQPDEPHPLSAALGAAGIAGGLGLSIFLAIQLSADNFIAILPANGILITALIFLSGVKLRLFTLMLGAVAAMSISGTLSGSTGAALAFALANTGELLIASYLIIGIRSRTKVTAGSDVMKDQLSDFRPRYSMERDCLTGLASRTLLIRHIEAAQSRSDEVALLFIDLDNFKCVNDTFGHNIGDYLLKTVAGRLRHSVKEADVVARLGDDEFAVLLSKGTQPVAAGIVARRISDFLNAPMTVGGHDIRVGASIGVACWQPDTTSALELFRRADVALYRTKSTGRGNYQFFEPEMDRRLQERQEIEQDLRRALADHSFDVHYQPIVRLATNEVTGLEALIRWRHHTRGNVSPSEFIPIAEEIGIIAPIGDWVLRRACHDAANWPEHVKISVNLSRAQFESPYVKDRLSAALSETGLAPNRLQLEITETTIMADFTKANSLLGQFRELGIETAMDDFGTGYSSLSCLRSCPFDRLKIDRSFINDLTTSLEARLVLATIVKLATTLGMHTTAEGVETQEQYEIVKAEGCGEIQGYYFSPPKSAAEISDYFAARANGSTTAA